MEKRQIRLARWFLITAMTAIFVITGMNIIIKTGYVSSESMEPTLAIGARIVGFRLDHDYRRGDIVMFSMPNIENRRCTKRIIGIPGDVISLTENAVYANGKKIDEPYLKEDMDNEVVGEYRVPPESYFLMGDNRNQSYDSRHWVDSFVSEDNIICKVRFILFNN